MDTRTLQDILNTKYRGLGTIVCAKDELFKVNGLRKAYIVNTDPSSKPGEHWVCFYYANNSAFYFDSYGGDTKIEKEIESFLNGTCKMWVGNSEGFQSDDSDVCGIYCLHCICFTCIK